MKGIMPFKKEKKSLFYFFTFKIYAIHTRTAACSQGKERKLNKFKKNTNKYRKNT